MYKFDPKTEPVETSFRAIALDQLDEALADLGRPDGDGRSVVHDARRRCKKLRGLLRLVRPAFKDFTKENAAIRDAAGLLSHLRDAEVLQQTVADLAAAAKSESIGLMAQRLAAETAPHDEAVHVGEFRDRLAEVRQRAEHWELTRTGRDAALPGFRLTYRSARERMRRAKGDGEALHMHEWRKAHKNHGFHIDLLKRLAPDLLSRNLDVLDDLSTQLGLHHDLAVLTETIERSPERFGDEAALAALNEAIATRSDEVTARAFELGRQIYAEPSRAIAARFAAYWSGAL